MTNLYRITQTLSFDIAAEDTDDAFEKLDAFKYDKSNAVNIHHDIETLEINYVN